MKLHEIPVTTLAGETGTLEPYRGKVLLIVNVASHCGYTPQYKGLERMHRELGPRGLRVNTISPGWVMTERQLRQFVTPAVRRLIKTSQCIPVLIQPDEIASVALFLASDASRAITGQEILVDRGWQHS